MAKSSVQVLAVLAGLMLAAALPVLGFIQPEPSPVLGPKVYQHPGLTLDPPVVSADTLMIADFGQDMIDVANGLPLFCNKYSDVAHLRGDFVHLQPGGTYLPIFSTEPEHFVSVGGSSVFIALQMAYYMGIREVFLYGIDYSFKMTLTRDPRYPFPVAYDEGNHFIKSYRSAKPWCPPTWRDISAGFLNARATFEADGRKIVNVTRGGLLETFERQSFDDVVHGLENQSVGAGV